MLLLLLAACNTEVAPPSGWDDLERTRSGEVCDSTVHEASAVEPRQQFDLGSAVAYLQKAGCDFDLDPNADGTPIASSVMEDLWNDPAHCTSGTACTGCSDADSIHTVNTCEGLAATSYFAADAWKDLAAACPPLPAEPAGGCTIEGVVFASVEATSAMRFFEGMTCEGCSAVLDSRTCEDAINDAAICLVGSTCSGCTDGDGRSNGVSCDEIAEYSYFGTVSAQQLLAYVKEHPSGGACAPACAGRTCGDDGCGGSCGACTTGSCNANGTCSAVGCSIEGQWFDETQVDCALSFVETMDCEACTAVFDSRICEDAINDPAKCFVGTTCDGCEDGDTVADGVTCPEIEAYGYFGAAAAQKLYAYVQADNSCGAPSIVVDGVPLTPQEAEAVVTVANQATLSQLDDEVGLDTRCATNVVGARPFPTAEDVGAVSYVGATAIRQMRDFGLTWHPTAPPSDDNTIARLYTDAMLHGTSSVYYGKVVHVPRAIVTSMPSASGGGVVFYVADPVEGNAQQLRVYVGSGAALDTSWTSTFDDIALTATFTKEFAAYQLRLDQPATHTLTRNDSGIPYADWDSLLAAWSSTADHPEGAVRIGSTAGDPFVMPMPVFLDHPMWAGKPPAYPRDTTAPDEAWQTAAAEKLAAWNASH